MCAAKGKVKKTTNTNSKKTTDMNSGNTWGTPPNNFLGSNAFPGGQLGGKSAIPGRIAKALSGPVHPGFEESAAKQSKKKADKSFGKTNIGAYSIQKVDQSKDLYSSNKKINPIRQAPKK